MPCFWPNPLMAGPGKRLISTTTCWPVVESRRETPFSHIQCNPDSPSGGVAHGSIVGGGAPHSGRCVVVGPSPIAGDELDGGRGRAHSEWTQTEPTPTTKLRPMPAATLVAPTPISPTSSPASPISTATIPLPDATRCAKSHHQRAQPSHLAGNGALCWSRTVQAANVCSYTTPAARPPHVP